MRIEALLNTKKREERKAVAKKITVTEGSNHELRSESRALATASIASLNYPSLRLQLLKK